MKNFINFVLVIALIFLLSSALYSKEIKLLKSNNIINKNPEKNDMFGWQVSHNDDFIVISTPYENSKNKATGSVYVYKKIGDSLIYTQNLKLENSKNNSFFGNRIAQSNNLLAITSTNKIKTTFGEGYIHLFNIKNGLFEHFYTIADDSLDSTPSSIAIDGNYLIIGIGYSNKIYKNGAIKIYAIESSNVKAIQIIEEKSLKPLHYIGQTVAIQHNILAFSSISADGVVEQSGAVWIYLNRNGTWEFSEKIIPADGKTNDFFGNSIAIDNNTMAIGAMRQSTNTNQNKKTGAVYIYNLENEQFIFQTKLYPDANSNDYDYFGVSLDFHNNVLAVGANCDDESGKNSGAVYIFKQKGSVWKQTKKLKSSSPKSHSMFGSSVSSFNGTVVSSSHLEENDTTANDHGVVYFYTNESISDVESSSDSDIISVYPNPVQNIANFRISYDIEPIEITLLDLSGREIQKIVLNNFKPYPNYREYNVSLNDLNNAVYLLHIRDKSKTYTLKIVKN